MEKSNRVKIADEFENCIKRTITRLDNEETHRPFHRALLSDEALFWSRFERSFSTSFGQGVIERISCNVALAVEDTTANTQHKTTVNLSANQLSAIEEHINLLRYNNLGRLPHWDTDLQEIQKKAGTIAGELMPHRVISDLWWHRDGIDHYMSIKTVKPNIDQTAEAKRDLLKLKMNDPNCKVYFGLYYNPYGDNRIDYKWSPPMKVFDFHKDPVVLIGRDYWDTIGGTGCYQEILDIAKEVGVRTKELMIGLGNKETK